MSSAELGKRGHLEPVDAFVKQQVAVAERLVALVAGAFEAIEKVARGAELLTPAVAAVAECLIKGAVPDAWDAVWEGPTVRLLCNCIVTMGSCWRRGPCGL